MVETQTEIRFRLNMFSRLERERLQALGLTVYETVLPATALPAEPAPGFWQTRLGLNISRYAEGIDTAALPASVTGAEGKKLVWNIIRSLRIGR